MIHILKLSLKVKECISIIIIFLTLGNVTEASTISLTLELYKNDTVILKDWHFTKEDFGTFLPYQGAGNYYVRILDKNGSIIYSEKFNVLFFIQVYKEDDYEILETNFTVANIRLHLPKKSFLIKFYRNEKEIFSLDLSTLVCNKNNICDEDLGEDEYLCPNECLKLEKDAICGNKVCESGETQENCCKDCGCPKGFHCIENKCVEVFSPTTYLVIIFIVIILVATIIIIKARRASKDLTQSYWR